LKARAKSEGGQIAVFFIDDNFAINIKRTKSLLRDIIAAGAQVHWVAQISANLLRDEELVDLIAASGGKWVFIGMESIDPNKILPTSTRVSTSPANMPLFWKGLPPATFTPSHLLFSAWTTDTVGVAERTLKEIRTWPAGAAHFWIAHATASDSALQKAGSGWAIDAPKHWQENSSPLRWPTRR